MPRQNIVTRASLNLAPISTPQRTRFYSRIPLYLKHCIEMELQCKPSIRWNRSEEGARVDAHELLNFVLEIYIYIAAIPDFTNDSKGRASKLYRGLLNFSLIERFILLDITWFQDCFHVYRYSVDRVNCKLAHRKYICLSLYCDTRVLSVIDIKMEKLEA